MPIPVEIKNQMQGYFTDTTVPDDIALLGATMPIFQIIRRVPDKTEIAGPASQDSLTWQRYAQADRARLRAIIGNRPEVEAYLDRAATWREMSRWACDLIEQEWKD